MKTDICIIGGGSGGVGAAYASLSNAAGPLSVTIVERDHQLGGTSTNGGVNCWEPGVGGPGLHHRLASLLSPRDAGVGRTVHFAFAEEPYGLSEIDPALPYEACLRRAGFRPAETTRFHFQPEAMATAMEHAIYDAAKGREVAIRYGTSFLSAEVEGRRVARIRVYDGRSNTTDTIEAKVFIDASADIVVARDAGCETAFGEEPESLFGEPSAAEEPSKSVNGVTFVIIARRDGGSGPEGDAPPEWTNMPGVVEWAQARHFAAINKQANGDLCINCLPTMEGAEYFSLPDWERTRICRARMHHLWHVFRTKYGFSDYRLVSFARIIGVRESYRLRGRYVLREQDVRAGLSSQPHRSSVIAYGDHALDIHGARNVKYRNVAEVEEPYGVPFDCLATKELDNLLVACRGASFSHVAASSCRLSRTMMATGEAAGTAASLSIASGTDVTEVDPGAIRDRLGLPRYEEELARRWQRPSISGTSQE